MAPYQKGDTVYVMDGQGKKVMLTVKDIKKYWKTYGYNDYLWEQYQTIYVQSEQGDLGYTIDIDLSGGSVQEYGMVTVRDLSFYDWGGFEYDAGGNVIISPGISLHDSLMIADRVYYDVISDIHKKDNDGQIISGLYYNKTYGVLQKIKDGKPILTLDTLIFASAR